METLERHANTSLKCEKTTVNTNVAKVSIVGAGMMSNAGVAAKMFEALYDAGVNICRFLLRDPRQRSRRREVRQ